WVVSSWQSKQWFSRKGRRDFATKGGSGVVAAMANPDQAVPMAKAWKSRERKKAGAGTDLRLMERDTIVKICALSNCPIGQFLGEIWREGLNGGFRGERGAEVSSAFDLSWSEIIEVERIAM